MKLIRYLRTIWYLKPIQIWYLLKYRVWREIFPLQKPKKEPKNPAKIIFQNRIYNNKIFEPPLQFTFLNISHRFQNRIYWNYPEHRKLWTYNLNYFDFLHQESLEKVEGIKLIQDWIKQNDIIKDGWEAYPSSLRIINWVKFISEHSITDPSVNKSLFNQAIYLSINLEYHLLANHLLENAIALLFAAYFFKDVNLYSKAKEVLEKELEEQVLRDGAHFELSPMYHQILLYRLLDSYQLVSKNDSFGKELENKLAKVANQMMAWLNDFTFSNGDIPMVNDSYFGITPSTKKLFEYYKSLNLPKLEKSEYFGPAYKLIKKPNYELFVDFAQIGPDYQPGHAHADTFNIILYVKGRPIIVDSGTSTYEIGDIRNYERSTAAHNTVVVNGKNSTDVWSSFRVANRAQVYECIEKENYMEAKHDGYKSIGVKHLRRILFKANSIDILDQLKGTSSYIAKAYFHFHPEVSFQLENNTITSDNFSISFEGAVQIHILDYSYAAGFNLRRPAKKLAVSFERKIETKISIL